MVKVDKLSAKFLTKEPADCIGQAEKLARLAIDNFFGKKYQHANQITVDQGFRLRFEDDYSVLVCASEYHDETVIEIYESCVLKDQI